MIGERHSFRGYTDTLLLYDSELKEWRLELYSLDNVTARVQSVEYPFGVQEWEVTNDVCNERESEENSNGTR